MSLFKYIFSITDTTYRTEYRILGIKIAIAKPEYQKKRKENPYYYYKKNNIDITTIPPATGQIRDVQLANLALLKEMDYVCKQNGLKYWLDGGTLLGAIRHKGFIPWDDDIDTAMLRDDYEKLVDAFKKSSRNPDIYAVYFRNTVSKSEVYIKVLHKKCPHLFVDIFPWDIYGQCLSTEKQLLKTQEIKKIINKIEKNTKLTDEDDFVREQNAKIMKEKVLTKDNVENSDYVWGIDFHHQWKNWFSRYDVLNPLKTIEFEGMEFPCLNNPDSFLTRLYGDYMSYPKKISMGHSMFLKFSDEELKVIKDLLKGGCND